VRRDGENGNCAQAQGEARLQRLLARLAERGIDIDEIGGNDDEAQS
jgi:hypothetical protein